MIPKAMADRIVPQLADTGQQRLEKMDKGGVDLAVLSNGASVQGDLDPTTAMRLSIRSRHSRRGVSVRLTDSGVRRA